MVTFSVRHDLHVFFLNTFNAVYIFFKIIYENKIYNRL